MSANGIVCSLLLDPGTYTPDTLDLNSDEEARIYWFNCIPKLIENFSQQAARSEHYNQPDASARAQQYVAWLHDLFSANEWCFFSFFFVSPSMFARLSYIHFSS